MADGLPGAVVVLGVFFAHRHPALPRAAARRGLAVLGVDKLDRTNTGVDAARRRDPGHPLADLAEVAWLPPERGAAVLERVLAWSGHYDIQAVAVLGEDFVEAGGLVADCLGLRGPGLRASRVCRNKLLQRRFLAEWSPRSRLVPADAREAATAGWDAYPAVVKPVGRTASSGVRRVSGLDELRAALSGFGPGEPALVEELVEGPELSVESLVRGGRVVFASPTGKRTNEADGTHFVEMGHTVPDPTLSLETSAAVLAANAGVLARLGFADGAAHAEFRVAPDGRVTLMEVAARLAGDAIPGLCHLATGVPLEETLLAILLGEAVDGHPAPRRFARQVFVPHEPGTLRAVRAEGLDVEVCHVTEGWAWPEFVPPAADAPGRVHMVVASRPPGSELGPIRESVERCAAFVVDAPTVAELDRIEARCLADVRVEVEPGKAAADQPEPGARVEVEPRTAGPDRPEPGAAVEVEPRTTAPDRPEPVVPALIPAVLLLGDPSGDRLADGPAALVVSELTHPVAAAETACLAPTRVAEIVDAAAGWSRRYAVEAVRPLDDRYHEAAAVVADLLGLPAPGLRAARVCGDEALLRRYLAPWLAPADRGDEAQEYSITSYSLGGDVRDIEITVDGCDGVAAEDRLLLSQTHEAILKHLRFGTGTTRADYRRLPDGPAELVRIAIVP